ncbi:hypothetical protein B0H16DRAFT_901082 [Mycena metata]|uniref:OTU domain-containing protein n=1 Tax=Mycena metata TaxID=1033252 RepID=A0AAD7IR93_9AGAR|nr:hypothetical protein B0H16DRAFT_901082 [Mycena metata]
MGTPKKSAKKMQGQLRPRTTRSSKARLLTDPMENTALLTEQLRSLGLYAAPTVGDGNCLFRALSDQLYGSPSKHPQLRRDVCDWIARHKTRYEPFVEDERGLEVHLRCMRENATYGGHMELSAFAHLTRRNVKVIQPGLVYVIEWAAGGGPPSPTVPTHSNSNTAHASTSANPPPPPPPTSTSTANTTGATTTTTTLTPSSLASLGVSHPHLHSASASASSSSLSSLSSLAPSVSPSASAHAHTSSSVPPTSARHREVIDVDADGAQNDDAMGAEPA